MRHIFIMTYGRSGSTVLQNVLNTIPGFCIRGENGAIVNDFVAIASALEVAPRRVGASFTPRDPWYGIDKSDPASLRKGLADLFVKTVLCPPRDCRATGFKEIRYTPIELDDELFARVTDFLLNEFEHAQIIFNMRQPAQVARSGWWAQQPADDVIRLIERTNMRFANAHARHPKSTFLIDYADFNGRPEGLLPLIDWLGEELPAEQLAKSVNDRLTHMRRGPAKLWNLIGYMFK